MIGLDTNVVVRYLTQDDPKQSPIATRLMEKTLSSDQPGFISLIVLAECAVAARCKRAVTFDRTAAATTGFELLT